MTATQNTLASWWDMSYAQTSNTHVFFRKSSNVVLSPSAYLAIFVWLFLFSLLSYLNISSWTVCRITLSSFSFPPPYIQLKWQFDEKFHLDRICCFRNLSAVSVTRGQELHSSSTAFISQPRPGTITVCSTQTLSFAEPLTFSVPLQVQDSLNPNNLEYWMEDIYTPGYDSLLKRKEAEFRRAKACKIGALIAAAACTVILVIVVPICTMKSWGFYLFFCQMVFVSLYSLLALHRR